MIRAGIIGTGAISAAHLDALSGIDDVEVSALCDVDGEAVRKACARYGGTAYTDYREMLSKSSLDAVWLCTPPSVREEPLLLCAERDIPVMCEKPVATDNETARRISTKLGGHDSHVQVGFVFRTQPVVSRLKDEMASDRIHAAWSFYGCNAGLAMSLRPWFYDFAKSGGALGDQATHVFDLLRFLLGEVTSIQALAANPVHPKREGYTVDEVIALSLLFENGAAATHMHSLVASGWRTEIGLAGEKRFYRIEPGKGALSISEQSRTTSMRDESVKPYRIENDVFLDLVRSGDWKKNPCTYAEGAKSLALTLACNERLSPGA